MGEPDVGPSTSSAHLQTPALRSAKAVHLGYQCDSCLAEPIVGIRWHCLECRGAFTVDLCDECREEGTFETERHRDTHSFQARREAEMEPYYANEVASMALREYSYLA
ncbi:ZZ-type zinc finger-containing protein 3 [Coemansia biformis]|uniref:ZZ-type zinc finger-containing protein 3 n=1 Tax=Coemansia biformis TaxID=1286918 RepID=A0A9W7YGG5_9FUNG|nr:ZZ-type zinc finger-containing protein 3 [Coemansia biformis]